MTRGLTLAVASLLCFACGRSDLQARERARTSSGASPTPTYVEHVGPLLEARCSGCHAGDRGDGTLALRSYEQAWSHRFEILAALDSQPPEEGACPARPFAWSEADRSVVQSWASRGAPMGDPSEFAPRPPPLP